MPILPTALEQVIVVREGRLFDDCCRADSISWNGVLIRGNFLAESDEVIPHFRRITEECHRHDTTMIHQIYHIGGHGDQDNSWEPYWSPSAMPSMHDPWGSHAMLETEIEEVVNAFVNAARRDKEAGFDGVEIFSGYNCLVDQLHDSDIDLYTVGDAVASRTAHMAIYEARKLALDL